jgi:RimJ/RimL family protein N-acetyltransferase
LLDVHLAEANRANVRSSALSNRNLAMPYFPILETERLILRVPEARDFDAWAAFMQDEESARYVGGVQAPAASYRSMASLVGCWVLQGFAMFSMIEKPTGRWVGRTGPWAPHAWPGTEVGWGVVRSDWGKGYATEAARAAIDFAVDTLGWMDIIHCIDPANVASQAVARRLGAKNRGPGKLPPPFESHPIDIWGQSADDWKRGEFYGRTLISGTA